MPANAALTKPPDEPLNRSAGIHNRIATVLLIASIGLVGWRVIDLPRLFRLATNQPDGARLLVTGAAVGDTPTVRRLLDQGIAVDAMDHGYTALMMTDDPALARLLLARGANPSVLSLHQTPLLIAASKGNLEMVKILLEAGVDPNQHDAGTPSALVIARMWRHEEVEQLLLARSAK